MGHVLTSTRITTQVERKGFFCSCFSFDLFFFLVFCFLFATIADYQTIIFCIKSSANTVSFERLFSERLRNTLMLIDSSGLRKNVIGWCTQNKRPNDAGSFSLVVLMPESANEFPLVTLRKQKNH